MIWNWLVFVGIVVVVNLLYGFVHKKLFRSSPKVKRWSKRIAELKSVAVKTIEEQREYMRLQDKIRDEYKRKWSFWYYLLMFFYIVYTGWFALLFQKLFGGSIIKSELLVTFILPFFVIYIFSLPFHVKDFIYDYSYATQVLYVIGISSVMMLMRNAPLYTFGWRWNFFALIPVYFGVRWTMQKLRVI
jgi:hypothetical protein